MATPARAYCAPRRPNQPIQPTAGRHEMTSSRHVYEVRPRKDRRGFELISEVLPFGRLWYDRLNAVTNAIGYAMHDSRSHDALIRLYDGCWQRDRDTRVQGRFQRVVERLSPFRWIPLPKCRITHSKACSSHRQNLLSDVFRAAVKKDASAAFVFIYDGVRDNERLESAGVEEDYLLLRADDVA